MSNLYRFGQFALDSRRRTLSRADSAIVLTPKAFDVLLFLVQSPNRLVTKEELLKAVWADTFVEEGNLTQYISHLRKALGDNPEDARLIVTIARKGYQFTGNVSVAEATAAAQQGTVTFPAAEMVLPDMQPVREVPASVAVAETSWQLWKSAVAIAAAAIVVGAGYLSWRQFLAAEPPRSPTIMLAVLPFQNLTGDPNKEYLADGLTEEMISQLSRLAEGQLGVIARTSVMTYKQSHERLDQIGRDLSVQYVLESSLRESGDHLRLTAQLIQVKDQTHLWSQDYDYHTKDMLTVEDDVAKAVAHEIRLRLSSQKQAQLAQVRSSPANPEAFDAYLQGFYFFQRRTDKDSDMAARYYERATQLDPSYAPAWAGLSRVLLWQINIGSIPAEEGHRRARQAVERALALNPNLAAAHAQMGRLRAQVDFDWAGGDTYNQRAIALEPGNPEMIRAAAASAQYAGRFDDALQLAHRAASLDPLNADSWAFLSETEFLMGQLGQAATDGEKAIELNPDVWPGPILLSQIYLMQRRMQDALHQTELVRYPPWRMFLYSIVYHALGRNRESDATLNELISKYPRNEYQIAEAYAFRNQPNEAFEWLNQAYVQRNIGLVGTKVDPLLRSLHEDPRYVALLKKLKFSN
jgi:TolB-like protein/DNA-binding winged helix-turn-helix (wHTH) protein